jgi:hypothetical protein
MIKPDNPNSEFQLGGINHVALVCARTCRRPSTSIRVCSACR